MTQKIKNSKSNKDDFCKNIKKNWPTILISIWLTIYVVAMGIIPTIRTKGDWSSIQSIWFSWQTYNSAIIALIASVIAYKATTYADREERKNNFRAAKSKLPHALSDFVFYLRAVAKIHEQRYHIAKSRKKIEWENLLPSIEVPATALGVFVDCIRYSDPNIGIYLAKILEELQVIKARTETERVTSFSTENEYSQLKYIANNYIKIEHLFSFARNEEDFSDIPEIKISDLNHTLNFPLGIKIYSA